jgi:thioredoxin reductase (NADPH)
MQTDPTEETELGRPGDDGQQSDPQDEILDLLIVGGGPAGLAAACAAQDAGISYLVVERCGPVQSLVDHPQQIAYFSPADEMAIGGIPFPVRGGHRPTREDALAYFRAVIAARNLPLATWEEVVEIAREADGVFRVRSVRRNAGDGEMVERRARFLLLCTGTFPNPRRLDIPGASLPKVFARLDDPTPFFGRDVLVIGGGNSAATAAMTLAEAGARVTIAMRRPPEPYQSHLRPFIVRDLTIMADEKRLTLLTDMRIIEITPRSATLARMPYGASEAGVGDDAASGGRDTIEMPNDFVFAMIGHTADATLFKQLGIALDDSGLPFFDQSTGQSEAAGVYIAGSLSHANLIIEARKRAVSVVQQVASRLLKDSTVSPE